MSGSGLEVFDTTIQETNHWLKLMMEYLGTRNRRQAFNALRAGLHVLRDRIGPANAVHLGAQLPMLLRGAYYEGWRISETPTHERHIEDYLDRIDASLPRNSGVDACEAARATFSVLSQCVDRGEAERVLRFLPPEVRALWPVDEDRVAAADSRPSSFHSGRERP
jgi:uncharacterized protein (DUF2267 family)